jgi:hypothetical protein
LFFGVFARLLECSGFSLLQLYTGGFALSFYKTRSRLAREWSERSRPEIAGAVETKRTTGCASAFST